MDIFCFSDSDAEFVDAFKLAGWDAFYKELLRWELKLSDSARCIDRVNPKTRFLLFVNRRRKLPNFVFVGNTAHLRVGALQISAPGSMLGAHSCIDVRHKHDY